MAGDNVEGLQGDHGEAVVACIGVSVHDVVLFDWLPCSVVAGTKGTLCEDM